MGGSVSSSLTGRDQHVCLFDSCACLAVRVWDIADVVPMKRLVEVWSDKMIRNGLPSGSPVVLLQEISQHPFGLLPPAGHRGFVG
jgi:hypothetical protein